jgi:hypothetical protein
MYHDWYLLGHLDTLIHDCHISTIYVQPTELLAGYGKKPFASVLGLYYSCTYIHYDL